MFLLDELAGPAMGGSELKLSKAKRGSSRIAEKPERDALESIERYAKLFPRNRTGIGFWDLYSPGFSKASAGEEVKRGLGAATLQERHQDELLDGISRNIIADLLENHAGGYEAITLALVGPKRNIVGARVRGESIPIDHMLHIVSRSYEWDDLPTRGDQRLIDFSVRILGKPMVLRFTGELEAGRSGDRAPGAKLIPVTSISKIELLGRSGHPSVAVLQDRLSRVMPDFLRRTQLASDYAAAPRAIGMPAELRAAIKRELSAALIAPESYKRIGFSSGSFPNRETLARVAGTEMYLRFERCGDCGDVQALSIRSPETGAQFAAARRLTVNSIGPWHRSICSASRAVDPVQPAQPLAVAFRSPED